MLLEHSRIIQLLEEDDDRFAYVSYNRETIGSIYIVKFLSRKKDSQGRIVPIMLGDDKTEVQHVTAVIADEESFGMYMKHEEMLYPVENWDTKGKKIGKYSETQNVYKVSRLYLERIKYATQIANNKVA